jgi:hypothetical protein
MQVWFPGAHSDVGGGYPESKLAEAPLSWMAREALACGLNVGSVTIQPARQTNRATGTYRSCLMAT